MYIRKVYTTVNKQTITGDCMSIFKLTMEQLIDLDSEQREKLYPSQKKIKSFQKYLIFHRDEREVSYKSPEEMWLEEFLENETHIPFEEYTTVLNGIDEDLCLCDSVDDLVYLYNYAYQEETSFPYFKSVKYKVLDKYVDFKRGHEVILEIFELDYKALGMKRPKKSDCQYFGITYTMYHSGDMYDYEGLRPYALVKKKIVVEEWEEC